MSFRIEEKIILKKNNLFVLENFIKKNHGKKLFEDREVISTYFDNKFLQMYRDSEEGCVPRKKIRLRKYSNSDSILFEKKISSVEGRFKLSNKINTNNYQSIIKKGIFDLEYGICKPIVNVRYKRSYYSILNKRVTIDREIKFKNFSNISEKTIDHVILEIKTNINDDISLLMNLFPFSRNRFSKYCEAIKILKYL